MVEEEIRLKNQVIHDEDEKQIPYKFLRGKIFTSNFGDGIHFVRKVSSVVNCFSIGQDLLYSPALEGARKQDHCQQDEKICILVFQLSQEG